jgi:predicted AAA+ superfamily ATPase
MNFKEFAMACGRTDMIQVFENWAVDRAIPDLYSVQMKKLLKEYYVVGGMPEAVKTWVESGSVEEVEQVQNDILKDYADDFSKHAPEGDVVKIRWIWDSIPVQLAKENRKFIFSHVKEGKRSADLEDALQWLVDAGLVSKLYMVENPESPLSGFADKTYFKVYMCDVGLLRVKSKVDSETIMEENPSYIRFKGAFTENYVLNELISSGLEPYFWHSGNTAEIDFIYESKGNLIPVEVKSADNTQAKSYKLFCEKYKPRVGFKLSQKNIAENLLGETRTYSVPLYLAWDIQRFQNMVQ